MIKFRLRLQSTFVYLIIHIRNVIHSAHVNPEGQGFILCSGVAKGLFFTQKHLKSIRKVTYPGNGYV